MGGCKSDSEEGKGMMWQGGSGAGIGWRGWSWAGCIQSRSTRSTVGVQEPFVRAKPCKPQRNPEERNALGHKLVSYSHNVHLWACSISLQDPECDGHVRRHDHSGRVRLRARDGHHLPAERTQPEGEAAAVHMRSRDRHVLGNHAAVGHGETRREGMGERKGETERERGTGRERRREMGERKRERER